MVFGRVKLKTFFTCDRGEIIFRKLHIGILQESINGGQKGVKARCHSTVSECCMLKIAIPLSLNYINI